MKRVLLSTIGTIAGLVALLSFKTHGQTLVAGGGTLPSAGLPGTSATPAAPNTPASSSTTPATGPSSNAPTASPKSTARSTTRTATQQQTYLGAAIDTRYGTVQVKVAVAGGKITNVSFVQLTSFDGRSQEINAQAGPILLQETLAAQSAQIDTVSGASYTSDGYVESLQSALDQAGIK